MGKILVEKIYCDRCGAEIPNHRRVATLTKRMIYTVHSLIPIICHEDWKTEDYYLCPQCEREYVEWFNRGKKND